MNEASVKELTIGVKGIITAEEHSVIGGLTSAITYILRGIGTAIEPVAIMDMFGQSGHNHNELMELYKLTEKAIIEKVKKML